ncbi:MAG: DUF255 domain-containing protein [Gemmatimonadaceae bacterium]|nr:DUF255 domain-containing protein [Gemmatimonadaceae bacterium]
MTARAALLAAAFATACDGSSGPSTAPSNRLAAETSPYLLLHAGNPVDWYPWGPEALALARREDRPIFLSVGYSTCYWCHVMEREVFSDPEIAAQMNEGFVNIKVDREERPDLDAIYMTATQILAGRGGWPNSVFLTPALEPFFAGTYFPPRDLPGRPGFPRVLEEVRTAWVERRPEVERMASGMAERIRRAQSQTEEPRDPSAEVVAEAVERIKALYDSENGGFGGAPKFPPTMRLELLRQVHAEEGDEEAGRILGHSLEAMARGGIHDHAGGGFHRYATDAGWRVPHFEKMLYNQAQMLRLYARAYLSTGDDRWRRVAEGILRYVRREMTSDEGAYFSALDAESEHVEGKYYTWTEEGVREALGSAAADTLLAAYGLAPVPEGEGAALYQRTGIGSAADALGVGEAALRASLEASLERLRQARQSRAYPLLDDKVITAWNGMMIAAAAEAGAVLGDEGAIAEAEAAARFVLERLREDGGLYRVHRAGASRYDGYLEDHAHLADGLLALHRAGGEPRWLDEARSVADAMVDRFRDADGGGGFFFTTGGRDLIARSKVAWDGALPAANAVAARVLLELGEAALEERYTEAAVECMRAFGGSVASAPGGHAHMITAMRAWLRFGKAGPSLAEGSTVPLPDSPQMPASADSIVKVAFALDSPRLAPGEPARLTVRLEIAEGWHVNANPASAGLVPTTVTVNPGRLPLRQIDVEYPPSRALPFPSLADTLEVWEGRVEVVSRLAAEEDAPAANGALRASVRYQACDDEVCLLPVEVVGWIAVAVGD